jgi:glycosyltransferase involved in cell wall biosynthesis
VVPNGVDFLRWPLGPGGDNLVWFGRITAEKAPHMAIAAARRADLPLVLAGPISDTAYFNRAIAPSLGDQIRYAGHLNHDELARLVCRSAAALVTPAWHEPYGLVVAEAMSCGTPVVAFARGGIPEIVSPQSGRLVPQTTSKLWPMKYRQPCRSPESMFTGTPSPAARPRRW